MEKTLKLTDDNWTYGSYQRIHYKKDMLYTFFQYVDVHWIWNVGMGTFSLQDRLADRLLRMGLISKEMHREYFDEALRFIENMAAYDTWPIEQIYGQIRRIRRQVLGAEILEQDRRMQMQAGCDLCEKVKTLSGDDTQMGVDQSAMKEQLLRKKDALIVALCQPELFLWMKKDVETALSLGCRIYMLVSDERVTGLPAKEEIHTWLTELCEVGAAVDLQYLTTSDECMGLHFAGIQWDETLQRAVDQDRAAVLVYGEEGLLHCRNLWIDAIVQAVPYGYHTRAMVNQLDVETACTVYIPPHFDITKWVGMTEKTQLSYWQLWQLWKDHGDKIYEMSVEQLYHNFPPYFLNVYENGRYCHEAEPGYPIRMCRPEEKDSTIADFCRLRDTAIAQYINRQEGLTYLSTYFTDKGEEVSIPWEEIGQQTGILVHGIRMAAAENARVLHCDTSVTLRQQLSMGVQKESSWKDISGRCDEQGACAGNADHCFQIFSNFLFFLTPKLAELYNKLREDRPQEQLHEKQGHLDYQLIWQDGKRIETFPLYRKAVLAKKRDGRFLLCQYRLGGGTLTMAGAKGMETVVSWSAEAVDLPDADDRIQIYTPYLSRDDDGEGMYANEYRCLVGADRINLVLIQDKIQCIRQGEVVLPSIGVVISLSQSYGQHVVDSLGITERADGYFDVDGLSVSLVLDGPEQIDPLEWQQVEWAYGGGLTLIKDGRSIYEGEAIHEMDEKAGVSRLREEGWLSPLSRQTQESALHVLAKHPRTAIGITRTGELFVLVFSGRTRLSAGADYQEMCQIAKRLIPDVETMMNVDGGGSSVLGMAVDGHFMELSYPATSMSSCAGMVRKVNTVLCLEF